MRNALTNIGIVTALIVVALALIGAKEVYHGTDWEFHWQPMHFIVLGGGIVFFLLNIYHHIKIELGHDYQIVQKPKKAPVPIERPTYNLSAELDYDDTEEGYDLNRIIFNGEEMTEEQVVRKIKELRGKISLEEIRRLMDDFPQSVSKAIHGTLVNSYRMEVKKLRKKKGTKPEKKPAPEPKEDLSPTIVELSV